MARKYFLPLVALLAMSYCYSARAQSVGIGTTSPNPHAILHVVTPTNNQGILLPALRTTERQNMALSSPNDDGLVVFDSEEGMFYFWQQGSWHRGLSDTAINSTLTYNSSTHVLTITGGSSVDLSSLSTIPDAEDIPVRTISGLTGTNVQDVLQELKALLVPQKIDDFSADVADRKIFLSLSADGETAKSVDLDKFVLEGLVTGTLDNTKIAAKSITPALLLPGSVGQLLRVNGSGQVVWQNYPGAGDISTTSITGLSGTNVQEVLEEMKTLLVPQKIDNFSTDAADRKVFLSLSADGEAAKSVDLDKFVLEGLVTGTLDNTKIAAKSITPALLLPGSVGQLLRVNGSGQVVWQNYPVANDISITSITGLSATTTQLALEELNTDLLAKKTTVDKFTFTPATRDISLSLAGDGVPDVVINLDDLPLEGVVTGTASATKIADGALLPKMIAPGTVGQVLSVDTGGNVKWQNQSAVTNTVTEYYSIDPIEFMRLVTDDKADHPGIAVWEDEPGYATATHKNENQQAIAIAHFPQKAKLKEIKIYFADYQLLQDVTFAVVRKDVTGENLTLLGNYTSLLFSPADQTATINLGGEVVDNSKYTYRVWVRFDTASDIKDEDEAMQRVYGARIEYEIDK